MEEISCQILHITQSLLGIWMKSRPTNIAFKQIDIALTNQVFVVTNSEFNSQSEEPHKLLLRIYRPSAWMFERTTEENIARIFSQEGMLPKWYGTFSNGRLEEYIDCDQLSASEFRSPPISHQLARNLSCIHGYYDDIINTNLRSSLVSGKDYLWDRIETWSSFASTAISTIRKQPKWEQFQYLSESIESMSKSIFGRDSTISDQRAKAESLGGSQDIIFGHCDLHHGNVIKIRDGKDRDQGMEGRDCLIIDYEYAIPTTRAFDLANFFTEFCSDYDAPVDCADRLDDSLFPDKKTRHSLLAAYLDVSKEDPAVKLLDRQVMAYLPFVQLHWGHWALIKSAEAGETNEPLGFNYLRYAHQRYNLFHKFLMEFRRE